MPVFINSSPTAFSSITGENEKSLLQRLKANEEQIQRNEQTLKNISDVKDSLQNEIQIYKTKERQLSKEKDEQLKRTNEEIRQKIMQLEKLSHTKDELEKNLLTLRSENSNLKKREQAREEERKKIEESRATDKTNAYMINSVPPLAGNPRIRIGINFHLGGQLTQRW